MDDSKIENTDDFAKPEGLSPLGELAYEVVMTLINLHNLKAGGSKTFYSPQEWRERKEEFGSNSELIVVYGPTDVMQLFDATEDAEWEDQMNELLAKRDLYFERCTTWYSAIYNTNDGRE